MEYIDGEDLASLLRRIGRLPDGKALDVAREIGAGLAAAHDVGVIHRDLKPANIMIDARGRARITDFGIAGMAGELAGLRERSGTPAYMAPEQLVSGISTKRSDLYALGLILYEIFTGRPRFSAATYDDLVKQHEATTPHALRQEIEEIHADVQKVVSRCLQEEPAQRPSSIRAVLAQLPQRDVLQAMIDAGDTPSPEVVATAGERGDLAPRHAVAALVTLVALMAGVTLLAPRAMLYGMAGVSRTPEALADRAREILETAGASPARDVAASVRFDNAFLAQPGRRDRAPDHWDRPRASRRGPIEFVYRQSPDLLVPSTVDGRVTPANPPATLPGMAEVRLDGAGRLIRLAIVPPVISDESPPGEVPWGRFFEFAGLDLALIEPVEPSRNASVAGGTNVAWTGAYPENRAERVRIEAVSARNRPVAFAIVDASSPSPADRQALTLGGQSDNSIPPTALVLRAVTVLVALVLARRNLREGRSDRTGAFRTAAALAAITFAGRLVGLDHVPSVVAELNLILYAALPIALTEGVLVWLTYVAVEPYIRRLWPHALIAWSRVITGRIRDPRVGRDLLFGLIGGLVIQVTVLATVVAPAAFGEPALTPQLGSPSALAAWPQFLSAVLTRTADALRIGVTVLSFLFLFLATTRSRRVAGLLLMTFVAIGIVYRGEHLPVEIVGGFIVGATTLLLLTRCGVLSISVALFVGFLVQALPLTFDVSKWHFGRSILGLAVIASLGLYGFHSALAGRSLFKPLLDES